MAGRRRGWRDGRGGLSVAKEEEKTRRGRKEEGTGEGLRDSGALFGFGWLACSCVCV